MNVIISKIKELEHISVLSKHDQIINGVLNAIEKGVVQPSDQLPSIGEMGEKLQFARKTVFRAYSDLRNRGLIESRNRQGYFIASKAVNIELNVAVVLFGFQTFQEIFYNTLRSALGVNAKIDVYFHHNSPEVFEDILYSIKSKYNSYVVAPIYTKNAEHLLKELPSDSLIIIDRPIFKTFNHVVQEFKAPFVSELFKISDDLRRYDGITMIYRENADFPKGLYEGLSIVAESLEMPFMVQPYYIKESVAKGQLYFVINDTELWLLVKDSIQRGYTIGKDVGIISHNDSPVKELVCGGITTFSTDFEEMAVKAANFLTNKEATQEVVKSRVIIRNSL